LSAVPAFGMGVLRIYSSTGYVSSRDEWVLARAVGEVLGRAPRYLSIGAARGQAVVWD